MVASLPEYWHFDLVVAGEEAQGRDVQTPTLGEIP